MTISTVRDLLIHQLRDLYSAEKQITRMLPKMVKASRVPELQTALKEHLEETNTQIDRLDQVFEQLEVSAGRVKCKGMEGLIDEGAEILEDVEPPAREVGMIGAAQKVEHYEIAAYGAARTLAEQLGEKDAARLLAETLEEEKAMDRRLNEIALGSVNVQAEQDEDEDEDEEVAEEEEPPRARAARGKAARGR